jgi:hypothetical protein
MGLLSALFGRSRQQSAAKDDRRGAQRFDAHQSVSIRRTGLPSVSGSLVNISVTGAAILIPGWSLAAHETWLTRLAHGDEIWLAGLLDPPVSCWVIAVDEGVLRVRFLRDDRLREKLRMLIAGMGIVTVTGPGGRT